jgi:DNA-binding transcriptional MerR regulator
MTVRRFFNLFIVSSERISYWHSIAVLVNGLKEESRIYDTKTFQPLKRRAMQFFWYVGIQLSAQRRILEERKPQLHRFENLKTRKGKIVTAVKQDAGGS